MGLASKYVDEIIGIHLDHDLEFGTDLIWTHLRDD
jgi:hypothetical protein